MKKKNKKICYAIIFILGLFLMAWQISIYRNTIIDISILFGIILVAGIIAFIVDFKNYGKTYKYSGVSLYIYSSLQYLCGFGFIVCSLFMFTNYYFAAKMPVIESYEIVERSSFRGRKYHREEREPTFKINYDGKLKQLVFPHSDYEKMKLYKTVELEVRKGFFGFDILENKKLKY